MELAESRKLTPDERKNQILDIALEAFRLDGYEGASMSRIAADLGGSKTTLYNYFQSKHELLMAVIDRQGARLLDQIFPVDEGLGCFRTRLTDLARRFLRALTSSDAIASQRLVVAESGRFPEVGQNTYELALERGLVRLTVWFQRAIDAGEMRAVDPRLVAEQFHDLVTGNLHRRRLWNVITEISEQAIANEAERIANTIIAAFGNDRPSRTEG